MAYGVIIAGIIAAASASQSADAASRRIAETTREGIAQQERFFNIAREDLAPYRDIGGEAIQKLTNVFINGDMDEFFESPGYKFNLAEGEKALSRKQGAAGSRYGGRALKEAAQYSQGVASQEYNNFFNRLNSLATIGANAASGSATQAVNTGGNISSSLQNMGVNQANIEQQGAANVNEAVQGSFSNYYTLDAYNKAMDLGQPSSPVSSNLSQPNYSSGNVTSRPSIFNR